MPVVSPHALPFGPAVRDALPGSVPAGDYVRHGSVFVERSIDRAFTRAEGYLRGDRIMRRVFDDLEHSLVPSYVTGNTSDDDHYKDATRTVTWDPHSALRTSDGGRQSPALGLGHELAHADEDASLRHRLVATYDRSYDNKEERRVILGVETHAAHALGEGTRRDHGGTVYRVNSPTSLY